MKDGFDDCLIVFFFISDMYNMILLDFRTTDEEQKDMSWTYTVYSNYIYISNN